MCSRGFKKLFTVKLGLTPYKEAWDLQKKLVKLRYQGKVPDLLLMTEHEPVITMGRATQKENLLVSRDELKERNVDLHMIERGGDITFHGPGQVVAYPIIDLSTRGKDLHGYLRDLESVIIDTLTEYGLTGTIKKGLTGVWVNNHKLAAIGVAVTRWVTFHGLALNVTTDLDYFKLINPCGITQFPVGSISSMLGKQISLDRAMNVLADSFATRFGYEAEPVKDLEILLEELAVA